MDPITPQPQNLATPELPSPHKHFLNKKFIVTFVILALLGTGAYAGIWYWGNYNSQYGFEGTAETFTPRPSALPDATAGWKTYTNTKYGFEFKYPSDWTLEDNKDTGLPTWFNSVGIRKNLAGNEYQKIQFISSKESLDSGMANQGVVELDGTQWRKTQFNDGTPGQNADYDTLSLFTSKGGINYEIDINPVNGPIYGKDGSMDPILNQILSTFKFINPTTSVNSFTSCVASGYPTRPSNPSLGEEVGGQRCMASDSMVFIKYDGFCAQVITKARNPKTGETGEFATPCDVPQGWQKI